MVKAYNEGPAMECSKIIENRGGSCLAASRHCSLNVAVIDPLGRGWCKRHAPDEETIERWKGVAAVREVSK